MGGGLPPRGCSVCKPLSMGKGEVKWEELQRRGPPVRALCFGINAYTSEQWTDLVNCERDAEEIAGQVRRLPDGGNGGCRAKVVKGPQLSSKRSMEASVKDFLKDVDKECPPRMLFISYSGHSIQVGTDIMMVPSGASGCDEPDKLKQECFSHNDLFSILYEDMHCKTKVPPPFSSLEYLIEYRVCLALVLKGFVFQSCLFTCTFQ